MCAAGPRFRPGRAAFNANGPGRVLGQTVFNCTFALFYAVRPSVVHHLCFYYFHGTHVYLHRGAILLDCRVGIFTGRRRRTKKTKTILAAHLRRELSKLAHMLTKAISCYRKPQHAAAATDSLLPTFLFPPCPVCI